jgi:hypothetical protein
MVKFLRLSSIIINTAKIVTIDILPKKYTVRMCDQKIDGWILFTSGSVDSKNTTIDVCENDHPDDYQTVKEWVHRQK